MATSQLLLRYSSAYRPLGLGLLSSGLMLTNRAKCENAPKFSTEACIPKELASNPLLQKEGLPKFRQIKPSDVVPAIEFDMNQLKKNFEEYENKMKCPNCKKGYSEVVERLEVIQAPLGYSWGVVGHLMSVKNSDDLRKAHDKLQPNVVETNQKIGQSRPVFDALSSLKASHDAAVKQHAPPLLDEIQLRIIENSLLDMMHSGVNITGPEKERFNAYQLELAELSTKFSNNVLDSTKAFTLLLTKPEDIEGLPNSTKALLQQNAIRAGYKESTLESGPWLVTLDLPAYLPVMQHLKNRSIREQLYRAYITRASEINPLTNNCEIITRILEIKYELAQLLGYSCHAEKSLRRKMASNINNVNHLITMLREKSYPAAQKELQELENYAKLHGFQSNDGKLALWDIPYWSERLREASYQYSEEELRPYFALPNVLNGLFQLANRLFGIRIVPVKISKEGGGAGGGVGGSDEEVELWHEDVQFFHVYETNKQTNQEEHIASFYLDPYSRPAEKRGGAWMNTCIGKSKALGKKPVAYLICNGSPPVAGKPSLMSFREVETLFHEFGHGLQHMLTRVEHADAAGINNIEWDAVELPSQFMENWCYDEKTLYSFAKHYETNELLPKELFTKIKLSKNYQAGLQMIRQLYFGAMDIYLHSSAYNPKEMKEKQITPFTIQHQLAPLYTVISPLKEDRFLCSFGHIFAGGYSAGYYSYKWAEVMSADAFAAFEEVGLDNEAKIQEIGQKFRETVLAMGGGKHPAEVFRLFRGRDPSPDALLRHSGLTK